MYSKGKIYLVYIIIFINIAHYFKSEISKSWLILGLQPIIGVLLSIFLWNWIVEEN